MSKYIKATKIVDEIFDEGFEVFGKIKAAERKVDELLISEKGILPKPSTMGKSYVTAAHRPYDNPNQFKVRSDNVEVEVEEDWPYGMGPSIEDEVPPDDEYDNIPDEENSEELEGDNPQKLKNKLTNVPNQSFVAQKAALKQDVAEMRDELIDEFEMSRGQKIGAGIAAGAGLAAGAMLMRKKAKEQERLRKQQELQRKREYKLKMARLKAMRREDVDLLEDGEYRKHFKRMMKKYGIKDPGELGSEEKKKEFFNAVDRSYQTSDEKRGDYSEDD